jgi:Ser/Thr protein kinase RdoA (MazF antagonist)
VSDALAGAARVAPAWGWDRATLVAIPGGLINATVAVEIDGARVASLQRLHPVFGPAVNLDIDAVTAHVAARGLATPRLVRTRDGAPWIVDDDGATWRALTWIDGVTHHAVPGEAWAEAGGELVGRFHRAVVDLDHDYAFARAGVHDTDAHLARLRGAPSGAGDDDADDTRAAILDAAAAMPALDPDLPRRHVHGDLKISNLVFAAGAPRAMCLIDLDTLGRGTIAFELGDAMRSWCNPAGEDAAAARFDPAIFAAAIRGYRAATGGEVGDGELLSIAVGLERVCVELAARFAIDVYEDRYFAWDATRYASRRDHNLARARGQLQLARSVGAARDDIIDMLLG